MTAIVNKIATKIFGSANERLLKRLWPTVSEINYLEAEVEKLTDDQLRERTAKFRELVEKRVAETEITGDTQADMKASLRTAVDAALDEVLVEAFAVVREASRRAIGLRHFDVQLIGGMVLNRGMIAEMKTGEGKTLVATLPAYLNAIAGRGVHVITVNDYLAKRDTEWMGKIYRFLGLTVGCIQHDMDDMDRKEAYNADITYGTNNEFGFDYLRDNMKFEPSAMVQRGHYYAIVDEVDSILIDEARTPLIISGASEESTEKYYVANEAVVRLKAEQQKLISQLKSDEGDVDLKKDPRLLYHVDEKQHSATMTEEGVEAAERILGVGNLYDPTNMELLHCVEQSLRAQSLYHLDKQYIVKDGEVIIVDEFTGRVMPGRRWSDGLHQAVESKEGVKIEAENQTLATITLQNYFRMYAKLSGMTGTAETEAQEFANIYKLDVAVIPTNAAMVRKDFSDMIYRTEREKWDAVVNEIKDMHEKGQPSLVGTVSVENSELLAARLKKAHVPHNVLNAKPEHAAREADIVAQAGRKGQVTIATNMAGRGTDILLGGNPEFLAKQYLKEKEINPDDATENQWKEAIERARKVTDAEHQEVVQAGGLHILGTERHESRRIDNQLRGRSGRQGDPGSSRFYLSLEDDLMRIFGGERIKGLMLRLGMEEGVPIESRLVSKRIEAAQKSVEGHNFTIRKHLLEYDDVMNKQREAVYSQRRQLLMGFDGDTPEEQNKNQRDYILGIGEGIFENLLEQYMPKDKRPDEWDLVGLKEQLRTVFAFDPDEEDIDLGSLGPIEARDAIWPRIEEKYSTKEVQVGLESIRNLERYIMLNIVDSQWKDHLLALDHLKEGIGLRGYGQKDPLVEYKRESFYLFNAMLDRIDTDTVRYLFNFQVQVSDTVEHQLLERRRRQRRGRVAFTKANETAFAGGEEEIAKPVRHQGPRVGRNDPCPCGSGKKYKKCCGA
ncbi:MAG: preprotein translocase subunit SecA [Blastocatellia bacterium AA13]|nr:MAG: preprotein translocase subunit SecA [Blastocatellia bacterium AA13]